MAEQQEVAPELKRRFAEWIDARTAKGIETYGGPLTTNNGRDARKDRMEELLDFCQYQEQEILELVAALEGLAVHFRDIDAPWRSDAENAAIAAIAKAKGVQEWP